jgi:hypothetical protein
LTAPATELGWLRFEAELGPSFGGAKVPKHHKKKRSDAKTYNTRDSLVVTDPLLIWPLRTYL